MIKYGQRDGRNYPGTSSGPACLSPALPGDSLQPGWPRRNGTGPPASKLAGTPGAYAPPAVCDREYSCAASRFSRRGSSGRRHLTPPAGSRRPARGGGGRGGDGGRSLARVAPGSPQRAPGRCRLRLPTPTRAHADPHMPQQRRQRRVVFASVPGMGCSSTSWARQAQVGRPEVQLGRHGADGERQSGAHGRGERGTLSAAHPAWRRSPSTRSAVRPPGHAQRADHNRTPEVRDYADLQVTVLEWSSEPASPARPRPADRGGPYGGPTGLGSVPGRGPPVPPR
jgi:hypothetical protein